MEEKLVNEQKIREGLEDDKEKIYPFVHASSKNENVVNLKNEETKKQSVSSEILEVRCKECMEIIPKAVNFCPFCGINVKERMEEEERIMQEVYAPPSFFGKFSW